MEKDLQNTKPAASASEPAVKPASTPEAPKNKLAKPTKPQTNGIDKKYVPIIVLVILASTASGFIGGYYGGTQSENNNQQVSQEANREIIDNEGNLITQIAKDVGESVVSINVTSEARRQSFFGPAQSFTQESAGTGVIVSEDGVIVTNRHVIPSGTTSVNVTLSDGTTLEDVEVIGRTNENDSLDIAFLKIKDKKDKTLKAAKLGDSSKMEVGDRVVAIGNALGQFQNTVTSGIISGYGRSVEAGDESGSETLQNLFQTDASINQGNSGGPLVNVNGEVIGINTAVAGGGAENIGFAIPINDIQGLVTSVLKEGKLLRPYLGVRYVTLNDDYAYIYNLDTKRGAYIAPAEGGQSSILKDSPAAKAGLKEKDIIVKVNDQPIDEKNSLVSVLGKSSVGDKVTLTVIRDGQEQTIDVTLEAAPEN